VKVRAGQQGEHEPGAADATASSTPPSRSSRSAATTRAVDDIVRAPTPPRAPSTSTSLQAGHLLQLATAPDTLAGRWTRRWPRRGRRRQGGRGARERAHHLRPHAARKILLIDSWAWAQRRPKLLALHDRLARTIQGHLDRAVARLIPHRHGDRRPRLAGAVNEGSCTGCTPAGPPADRRASPLRPADRSIG